MKTIIKIIKNEIKVYEPNDFDSLIDYQKFEKDLHYYEHLLDWLCAAKGMAGVRFGIIDELPYISGYSSDTMENTFQECDYVEGCILNSLKKELQREIHFDTGYYNLDKYFLELLKLRNNLYSVKKDESGYVVTYSPDNANFDEFLKYFSKYFKFEKEEPEEYFFTGFHQDGCGFTIKKKEEDLYYCYYNHSEYGYYCIDAITIDSNWDISSFHIYVKRK